MSYIDHLKQLKKTYKHNKQVKRVIKDAIRLSKASESRSETFKHV